MRSRRVRVHGAHGGDKIVGADGVISESYANLPAAELLPERSAPPSSKSRGTSSRSPAEPSVAVPGMCSGCLSALSAQLTHSFCTGLKPVQSRLRRGYLETSPR
jgi:hypothetical protein